MSNIAFFMQTIKAFLSSFAPRNCCLTSGKLYQSNQELNFPNNKTICSHNQIVQLSAFLKSITLECSAMLFEFRDMSEKEEQREEMRKMEEKCFNQGP